jgi:glutathione S-transferase
MKLLYSPTSPFVRKVLVTAYELGIADKIERVPANPREPSADLLQQNPLGKIPVLTTDTGVQLYDSPVICEFLDSEFGGNRLLPKSGPRRWEILTRAALGDGMGDAALLYRNETMRADVKQPSGPAQWQMRKVHSALDRLETLVGSFGTDIDLAQICFGCALGAMQFRMPEQGFLTSRPKAEAWFSALSQRPSFQATMPKG